MYSRKSGALASPGRPDTALVVGHTGHAHQPPLGLVQFLVVSVLEIGDANQRAVSGKAPPVIGTGEDGGVALIVPADLHPPVSARVEEYIHLALPVAAQDDRLFAHGRDEEVAGLGYLAFVADEQPCAGEYALLLFGVNVGVYEYFAANQTVVLIHQAAERAGLNRNCHIAPPVGVARPAVGGIVSQWRRIYPGSSLRL